MNWFFNKKQKIKENPKPAPCNHKWKDFPWYMESEYNFHLRQLIVHIIEPYVCIHCKQRKDIELKTIVESDITVKEASKISKDIKEYYKDKMVDKAFVEDMIHDMQLVDREYLKIAEALNRLN